MLVVLHKSEDQGIISRSLFLHLCCLSYVKGQHKDIYQKDIRHVLKTFAPSELGLQLTIISVEYFIN